MTYGKRSGRFPRRRVSTFPCTRPSRTPTGSILLIGFNGLFQLLFLPLNKRVLLPLSAKLGQAVGAMRRIFGRLVGVLWQLPKSVLLVVVFALLFNFYALLSNNTTLDSYINSSAAYRFVDTAAVQPIDPNRKPTNVALLQEVQELARAVGRPLAKQHEVKNIFRLE